jgi:hypothetical protein
MLFKVNFVRTVMNFEKMTYLELLRAYLLEWCDD